MDPIERIIVEMGEQLAYLRRARGISRRKASMLSGVSRETIYRLEGGKSRAQHYRGCTMDTFVRYCLALQIEFSEFCPTMEYVAGVVDGEAA